MNIKTKRVATTTVELSEKEAIAIKSFSEWFTNFRTTELSRFCFDDDEIAVFEEFVEKLNP